MIGEGIEWYIERVASGGGWGSMLAPAEVRDAEKIQSPVLRERFIVSRGLRRKVLMTCLGKPSEHLSFIEQDGCKPRLADSSGWDFNISHAGNYVALAVRRGNVGIDLELIREVREMASLVLRYFHPDESRAWNALADGLRKEAFFVLWAAREAAMKCLGLGLAKGLAVTRVDPTFMNSEQGSATVGGQFIKLHRVDAPSGYVMVAAND
jgi:4'-phosphopantetheinyl transferase